MGYKNTAVGLTILFSCMANTMAAASPARTSDAPAELEAITSKPDMQASRLALRPKENVYMRDGSIRKLRYTWREVPNAVRYRFVVTEGDAAGAPVAYRSDYVFNNGLELPVKSEAWLDGHFFYKVCALNFHGSPISDYTRPRPLLSGSGNDMVPHITSEYEKMDYPPLYPAYSWIPVHGASEYEVVVRERRASGHDGIVHFLYTKDLTAYDSAGYTTPGTYYWQVRALNHAREPISEWSEPCRFTVTGTAAVAALGDSITHGGGAVTYGPDRVLYDWESYTDFPVKNLGYSGDTVEAMLGRFDRDVLPFAPKILVIMGGVNNCRQGHGSAQIIAGLAAIRDKCAANNIYPVFLTMTSLHPQKMKEVGAAAPPPAGWMETMRLVNAWIMSQPYAVDVTTVLSDGEGRLEDIYTADGLHPDVVGKRYIGQEVSRYLRTTFPSIVTPLVRPARVRQ
ncbi:hypothetical protein TAMA11512_07330 [Selenomonas sp. TAMA-11512]|uniref:SGNH/GDSL hydrolase family protein n=1 Tax=Selenomonas sp. TAMA-11512 TaxID=3095337 RepID=UPI00308A8EDA|nr:hypothetical protein TAMA11512_07330 [Selenomonas sp. TAMA-11512]